MNNDHVIYISSALLYTINLSASRPRCILSYCDIAVRARVCKQNVGVGRPALIMIETLALHVQYRMSHFIRFLTDVKYHHLARKGQLKQRDTKKHDRASSPNLK
jgi:hypothetical protein